MPDLLYSVTFTATFVARIKRILVLVMTRSGQHCHVLQSHAPGASAWPTAIAYLCLQKHTFSTVMQECGCACLTQIATRLDQDLTSQSWDSVGTEMQPWNAAGRTYLSGGYSSRACTASCEKNSGMPGTPTGKLLM